MRMLGWILKNVRRRIEKRKEKDELFQDCTGCSICEGSLPSSRAVQIVGSI